MPAPDFDGARRERNRRHEPLTFTLGCGKACPDRHYDRSRRRYDCTGAHLFTCLAHPLVADALDLANAPERDEDEKGAVAALVRFIDRLLGSDDDRERFAALLARREDPIDNDAIFDVAVWLAEQYVTAPFGQPTGSSPGPRSGGASSKKKGSGKGGLTPSRGYSASRGGSRSASSS